MNARLLRFEHLLRFGLDERNALMNLMSDPTIYAPGWLLADASRHSADLFVILSGVACRSITLRDGRRQIIGHLLPGDFSDARACFKKSDGFCVQTLSEVEAVVISRQDLADLADRSPRLMRELWRRLAIDNATARQWLLNVGRRTALERVAHLLCEHFTRLNATGLTTIDSCFFPISQADMADALALSAVHVNRMLMRLRRGGLVSLKEHRLTIPDVKALQGLAGFDPAYLQIDGRGAEATFSESSDLAGTSGKLSLRASTTPVRGLNGAHPSSEPLQLTGTAPGRKAS